MRRNHTSHSAAWAARTALKAAAVHGVEADRKAHVGRNAVGPEDHIVCGVGGLHTPADGWNYRKQTKRLLNNCLDGWRRCGWLWYNATDMVY